MPLPSDCLDVIADARDPSLGPLIAPWPAPGGVSELEFSTFAAWRDFVLGLGLRRAAPDIVAAEFERAQKLYILAWLDLDLVKAGELIALTALELALTDRYAGEETARRTKLVARKAERENRAPSKKERWWTGYVSFADLLKFMVERDGLSDDQVPMNRRCGPASTIIGHLTGETRPSLSDIRNDLAHGAPIEGFPWAGLLELARDLVDYAYRDWPWRENSARDWS
jgi:hypothetical protein